MATETPALAAQYWRPAWALWVVTWLETLPGNGYKVAIHNRTYAKTEAVMDKFGQEAQFIATESLPIPLRHSASTSRGDHGQGGSSNRAVIEQLAEHMDEGDIIIDAENSPFTDTIRREHDLRERGLLRWMRCFRW